MRRTLGRSEARALAREIKEARQERARAGHRVDPPSPELRALLRDLAAGR